MERRRRIPFAIGATLLVAAALSLGGGAAGASTAPLSLYVTDVTGGSLVPVDVASGSTGTVIPVGLQPLDVAITEDGETAYVTAREAGSVVPVVLDAGSAGAPISVSCPVNIALVPGQTEGVRHPVVHRHDHAARSDDEHRRRTDSRRADSVRCDGVSGRRDGVCDDPR